MENETITNAELDAMRAQIALLKSKLEKETIVTDKLLRDAMKSKAHTINANAWISIACAIFVIFWAFTFLPANGFSWWLVGATVLMMLVSVLFTWKYHKNINQKTMNGDLVTVANIMKKLKKGYQRWLYHGFAMVGVWFVWMATEFCFILKDRNLILFMIAAMLIGLVVGGFIGIRMHKSVIHNADDIIRQIEEE